MKVLLIVLGIYVAFFFLVYSCARDGYGYMGYHGYYRGPSFFYFGGPRYYYGPSLRAGSVGGPGVRGGGFRGGK